MPRLFLVLFGVVLHLRLLLLALRIINCWILSQRLALVLADALLLIAQLLLACRVLLLAYRLLLLAYRLLQALLLGLPILEPLALLAIWGNVQRTCDSSVPVIEAPVADLECRIVVDELEGLS
jgi:hypothetical protein